MTEEGRAQPTQKVTFLGNLRGRLSGEFETPTQLATGNDHHIELDRIETPERLMSSNGDDDRDGYLEPILLNLKDESENGDLEDANSPPCGSRKRIFSQSDVEFD